MEDNKSRKWLYDKLTASGSNVGKDFDEFDNLMNGNEESRKWVYEKARNLGYNVGKDYDEFDRLINPVAPTQSKQEDTTAQSPVAMSAQMPVGQSTEPSATVKAPEDILLSGQLRRARTKLDELQAKRNQRASEVHDEATEFNKKNLNALGRLFVGGDIYVAKQQSDPEKNALDVAIRQTEELVKYLEEQQDRERGVDVGFWRGFGRVAGDVRSWDRGMSNAKDAITMLNADRLVDKNATEGERAAYNEMMEALYNKEQAEQAYGGNASFWNRAGMMTGHMPSFMLDFAMTGGGFKGLNMLSSGATKAATKALGKEVVDEMAKQGFKTYVKNNGAKGLGQYAADWTIKALGTTGDDLLVRAPLMTNTVQAGSTVADIVDRKLGGVTVNEDGTYDFSNDKTWSSAIWQGEANSIIENYSEMFGSHLDPVVTFGNMSKLANVVGAKRLGSVLAKADAGALSGIMGQTQKLFGKMGVSDYFGEVAEEYYGQLWRTMLNLDDAYQQNPDGTRTNLLDSEKFHGDIWGGMALSMGLMGVGKHTLTGAQYLSMKHGVNKADSRAAELLGKDVWEPLRQTIDQTTNDDIGSLAESIVSDPDFTNDELAAVFTYMERSLNMRGFNLGAMAQKRGGEGNQNAQSMDEHYIDGYNINSPQEMTDAKNMYDMQRQRVAEALGDEVLADIDRDPEAAIGKLGEDEPTNRTVIEYLNAKMVYDGMNKRVADDADARIAESDALVDSHTHKKTGMVQGATMKDEDRKVYIVNGNVVPLQDGTGIDLEASDNSIIIRDAESGELEQVSPEVLLSVDAALDPTTEKQAAREAIQNEVRANAERMQNGVVGFAPGDVYTVLGEDGNTHQVEIVQDNGDNTVTANVDGEPVDAMAKEQIQNEVDAYNKQRVVLVADSAQGAEAAENAADAKPNYELNAHVTLQTPEGVVTGNINQAENDDNLIEVQVNKPFGGKKTVDMYTREELDNMVVEVADENGNVIWSKPAENVEAAANVQGAENVNTPTEGGAENVNTAPAAPIVRGKQDQIDVVESIKAGTTPQQMADAFKEEFGDEDGLPLSTARENLAQVQEERQKTKDVNLKNGPLRKQEKFWSEVVDLLTPKEETVAEEGRQETVSTPVALQYLLEGGKGSIENAGYFFYAIQAAFPHIGAQLQEIRNSMPAEMLGMAPDTFVASSPSQLQEVRRLVETTYGEAGTRILDQMLANSTGFYPREGKAMDLEIENLKPVEGNEQAQEATEKDSIRFDNQGNPIDESGRLILEEVESIDQISDQDFEDPTRNIILPAIPDNVAEAVGTNGKPVIIKKNIFERNLIRHSDLTPDQSRDILKSALYSPDIYGQNQKRRRVNNWVVISVSDKQSSGTNKLVLLEVNENKENVEIVHWHYLDKRGMEKLKKQTEREGGQLLILPSASAEEVGALSDLTSDLPSEGKGTDKSVTAEGTAEEISENAQNATQSEQNELEKAEKERIDSLVPTIEDVADDMQTADEFVAGLFGNGIRITPESFRKETGLGWEEQRRIVGIIAGKEKGGLTVEQAAEAIVENYRAELAERGFSGDSMEMRDMVIDILSSGNPRAYAKEAAARRAEQALHREMEAFDRYTQEAFHMSAEEYIMYEESMLPKYIEQYKDFDEQEYYSNFADEQSTQNEHDTTRESAETGGSREILSEEQPSATPGERTAGEGQQGGTLQGDVQGDAQEGLARAEAGQEVAEQPAEKESRTRFSTSMFEDAERIAREEQRRAPLRRTAREWERILGVKVHLIERLEDVKNPDAIREIQASEKRGKKNVPGWFEGSTGEVFVYLPHVENEKEVDKTCVHEIVSHKGLKELLGQEKFDELCRKVWGIMSPAARKKYRNYPNVHNELEAADEYIAHLSEEVELTARERSVWQKIMDFIAGLLGRKADNRSKAASIVGKETLSRKGIAELVRLSYAEYLQRNGKEKAKPVGKGYFGEVYDQFKGKPKEAADFLLANKGGDLLGVFNRSGIGEIDAVWGDTTGGVAHIIDKHVGEGKSFKSLSEAFDVISDVIRNGNIIFQNGDKIIFHKGGNKVSIRKNIREKGKKIAEKNWILTAYDENAGDNTSAISDVNQGKAAPTPANSAGKDTANNSDEQGNGMKFRVSNDNQEIFVSNAQRAVEGIKQEKGTPQQWLAMIEKSGGLKAGEDKWLGLSDWLKGMEKKSVTKDEILDFIGENRIQIEEVHYSEFADMSGVSKALADSKGIEFRDAFVDAFGMDSYGEVWVADEEEAIKLYNESNEDELSLDEYGYIDERDEDILKEWAQGVLEEVGTNQINDTRLEYTTEGLDNKQEIALTVPTIEPWNQSDDIHFGDAGGGRAVAWVRFGETTIEDKNLTEKSKILGSKEWWNMSEEERKSIMDELKNLKQNSRSTKVLVIDEIQSKRHQEGREKGYNNPRVIQILDRMNEIQKDLYSPYGVSEEVYAEKKALQEELEAAFESENPQMKKVAEHIKEKEARLSELNREKAEKENDEKVEMLKLQDRQLETRNVREYDYYEQEINNIREAQERRDDEIDELRSSIRNLNEEYSHYYNSELRNARIGVMPAPFEKNWHELAMKRMLRYAAEKGFDKVAWTTGAQQAERYNMSKVVESIECNRVGKNGNKSFVLKGVDYNVISNNEGVVVAGPEEFKGKQLSEVVGVSLADKMLGMEEGGVLNNTDLRIGGEGMKGFYDKMLPSFVQKYTKKWGAKVGEVELPHLEEGAQKMWSVDVTPEMKESVMEGQTMFRVTDDIEDANARFNEELDAFGEGTLKGDLHLGEPGNLLKHLGLNATEMYITPKTLKNHMEKHGLKVADIKNLPKAMQEPLMVYEWGDKAKSLIVITQIPRGEQRITAAFKIERGGRRLEVNEIASVHGKEAERFMSDMINAKKGGLKDALKYVDKNKALEWLGLVPPKGTASLTAQELDVAKVIKDFQNPSIEGGTRFRSVDKLRDRYDNLVRLPNKIGSVKWYENLPYRLREAYQDSMLSLKVLQDVILEETGNTMTSGENAYMAENQMSSKNKAEAEMYERDFFKPMMEEVKNLLAAGATYDEVQKYLFAKHGLERNMEMYKKNKQEAIDEWIEERTEQLVNDGMEQADARAQAQQDIALYPSMSDTELDKKYRRDYSGLTALTEKDNVADAEAETTKMVSDFEGRFDTAGLWGKINAATKETLRKSYDSGMMDKATYNKILGMYHYYIPLRGWNADVAEKEYEYLSDRSLNLSPVLIKTKGRTSLADDPIATIGFMAEGAIVQGNRNLMKQRFMNFVLNNPTSLVSVSKQWYVEQADGTSVPDNPQIPADATGDQVAAIVEQHEQKMLSLGKKAKTKRAGLKLGLHATKQEGQEHMVRVKRGGKEYCLYINGSPRAAQALNGMTNPDASNSDLYKAASAVKNFMARMFTSQNPAFVVSNLSRDLIWAGTAVAVRENKDYAARYTKNVGKAFKNATLPRLLHKYQNGTLDMNVEEERLFMEFIKHGGETGFTQITSVEDYKKDIKRFVKEVQKGKFIGKKVWDGFFDTVEFLNRSAEDTTRFMVYMTSRQMGRDVATSVSDAKEITVNFNKKGSGGLGASVMNFCYIFFNAAIQSLSGFGKMMAEHPKRTLAGLTAYASAGVIVPAMSIALQALTGDDDDEGYWDLPEWIRRNNLVLYVPFTDSGFITIPLPHELRPFYAMGEIALSAMCGREDVEDGLRKVALNFAEMLPLDFTGNGGNPAVNLTPTIAQPVAQIIANKDYTGKPIYKDYEWNKRDPEWTKAYKGTSPWIVEGTKWLNRRSGGDDVKSGRWDWNPALIEHVLESYTGGAGKTFNRTVKTFQMMWDEDMRQWRNVPVISSFYQSGDERIQGSDVNNRYYEAKDEFEDTKHLLSGYKEKKKEHKPGTADYVEYARKLDELMNSDEYKRYKVFKGRQKAIKKVSDKLKETDDRNRIDSLNTRLMQLKEEMLEELEKADDSPKP